MANYQHSHGNLPLIAFKSMYANFKLILQKAKEGINNCFVANVFFIGILTAEFYPLALE